MRRCQGAKQRMAYILHQPIQVLVRMQCKRPVNERIPELPVSSYYYQFLNKSRRIALTLINFAFWD
jgi:hypothetical protein